MAQVTQHFDSIQYAADASNIAAVRAFIGEANINMISQGASEINLTFVTDESDVSAVVERLHEAFFTDVDPDVFA